MQKLSQNFGLLIKWKNMHKYVEIFLNKLKGTQLFKRSDLMQWNLPFWSQDRKTVNELENTIVTMNESVMSNQSKFKPWIIVLYYFKGIIFEGVGLWGVNRESTLNRWFLFKLWGKFKETDYRCEEMIHSSSRQHAISHFALSKADSAPKTVLITPPIHLIKHHVAFFFFLQSNLCT